MVDRIETVSLIEEIGTDRFNSIVRFLDKKEIQDTIQRFIYECKNLDLHEILISLQGALPAEWYVFPQLSSQIEEFLSSYQRLDRIEITIKNVLKL